MDWRSGLWMPTSPPLKRPKPPAVLRCQRPCPWRGETKSFRSFLSPWKSGSPWTWYYEKEGIVSLDDPPFFARSADSQSAIGSKGYINYAARFYTETGEEYYYAIMTRNGSLIDYARNSGAAFTSLPQTWFRSETAHIHFGRLAEEPFAMVLNFVNVMGAVMNVVADGKGFHYISDTLASNASTLVKYATVYQQIAPLASRMSQATDAAGFFGQFSLETLTSVMTDNVIPLLKLVVNANSVKNAALHKIWIKGSAKLAAKISTPAGWAVMIFDGVNSLVPTVSSMIASPVQAGYDLNWQSGNVVEVSRNDTRPVAEQTTHTVSFNSNGGSSVSSQQVAEGSYASEPTAPTRSGYVFRGWYGDSGLTNAWAFGSDTVDSDITLYAKWESQAAGSHTVTFDTNGGSAVSNQQVEEGSYASEPTAPPEAVMFFEAGTPTAV